MKLRLLRWLLMLDAALLFLLGALMIFAPVQIERAFHFEDLPHAMSYLTGLWGCVFITMGFGYVMAATNPRFHLSWVQVGIARGALECVLGLVYLQRGLVTWPQAGFGVIAAGLITAAYIVLYPRTARRTVP